MSAKHPLATWRRERNLTAEQFAKLIDVRSPISISRYENGKRVPRPKVMARIVRATDGQVTANDFTLAPIGWAEKFASYAAARRAELTYDRESWTPPYEAGEVPAEVEDKMEALTDERLELEEVLLAEPATTLEHLATKVLIVFDDDRDGGRYYATLLRDCRRFVSDELTRGRGQGADLTEQVPA